MLINMKYLIHLILPVFFLFQFSLALAQHRIDFEVSFQNFSRHNYGYQVGGENNLLVYYDVEDEANKKFKLHLELYDSMMNQKLSKVVSRTDQMTSKLVYYSCLNSRFYIFYYEVRPDNKDPNFKITYFDFFNKTVFSQLGTIPRRFSPYQLVVNGDAVYVAGNETPGECLKINMEDGSTKPANIQVTKDALYFATIENPSTSVTSLIYFDKTVTNQYGFKMRNFGNPNKDKKYTLINSQNSSATLYNLKLLQIDSSLKIGTGTYAENLRAKDLMSNNFMDREAFYGTYFIKQEGFYFTVIKDNIQEFIQFFPYPKITSKVDNERKKTLEEKLAVYKASFLDPVKIGSIYITVAEINKVNYTVMKTLEKIAYSANTGQRGIYTNGYVEKSTERKYTLVIGYNDKGNILWRDSFESESEPLFDGLPASFIAKDKNSENYILNYFEQDGLKRKLLTAKGIAIAPSPTKEGDLNDDEEDDSKGIPQFVHWYNNHYIYLANEKIKGFGPVKVFVKEYQF